MRKKVSSALRHPFSSLPYLPALVKNSIFPPAPNDEQCFELWSKYDMLPNVRRHSLMVAHIATELAKRASTLGMGVDVPSVRAAGMLHDLAKTWCLRYGGSHAIIGGAWVTAETGHYGIAQGVILHVHWPWPLPAGKEICSLPFFVIYADKRVRHDACVTLEERFEDLLKRYGHNENSRQGIKGSFEQAKLVEKALSKELEWNLNENSFDSWRLVQ